MCLVVGGSDDDIADETSLRSLRFVARELGNVGLLNVLLENVLVGNDSFGCYKLRAKSLLKHLY